MLTKPSRWVPTDQGTMGHGWIGSEPQLQKDVVIPGQAARKGVRNEGRNLVLERQSSCYSPGKVLRHCGRMRTRRMMKGTRRWTRKVIDFSDDTSAVEKNQLSKVE